MLLTHFKQRQQLLQDLVVAKNEKKKLLKGKKTFLQTVSYSTAWMNMINTV